MILHLGKSNLSFIYHISNSIIPTALSISDFGVLIDLNLTYELHIAKVISKARCRYCILFLKSLITRDLKTMHKFYISFVCPILEYGSAVWSTISRFDID